GMETRSYSVVVRRLSRPVGCSPLGDPAVWSFTAPRLNGSVDSALGANCYTFSRAAGGGGGSYWFLVARTAGAVAPRWRVLGPSASVECTGFAADDFQRCPLLASGQFTLVVDDQGGSATGSFFATARRASSPNGCSDLGPVAFGSAPVSGSISTG